MPTFDELLALHRETTDSAGRVILAAADADLTVPTPCDGWDLADLLSHIIGEQEGFTLAIDHGNAPKQAYAGPTVTTDNLPRLWQTSADGLAAAFARARPDDPVHLAQLDSDVTAELALGMQLLDTAVHGWDVATSLGRTYRPTDEVVTYVLDFARLIAARPGGTPGVFSAANAETGHDPWHDALRLLGRRPDGR
ncbi:TIGR03086 family metal-binding protein [Nocardioides sp. KR10-350]|uniref:TIGR03086 family metal-binding protein n=1 Tax=Nocardioides cheoyonin TaxID=3156615 RepID=UPI0032B5FE84